ncbi:MAG: VOC family protein [Sphingomicrobium sp.]
MPNPHGSFIWYELLTNDHGKAKGFYDPVMGWDIGPQPSGEIDYRMIRTAAGNAGGAMQLTEEMRAHGARPTWLGYIGVDDVDDTVRRAEAAGGRITMPAFDIPGVGRLAMLSDPQGALFYVMRGFSDESSNAFAPELVGHCVWNELSTTDLQAAVGFYLPLFNWTLGGATPMGEMGDYQFIEQGGVTIGAMFTPRGLPPMWRYCFRVANLENAMEATKAGGGTITFGPDTVPTGDRIFQALDPEGAHFMCAAK